MVLNDSTNPQVEAEHSTRALELNEVTKVYGRRAVVDKVSFVVERGEIFGLVGPIGSGKTTTIRMALDIIRPDAGRLSLLGGMPTRDALMRIGYLPEERGLYRKERVLDILRYFGRLKGLAATTAEARAEQMLRRVGLHEHRFSKVESLSRGMSQMVQFAGALLHEPDLIILDEPFSGLDPLNMQLIKEIIREQQQRGAAVIFSTHLSRVPGSGVRGRGSGERETTASSLAGKQQSSRKEDNSGQGKDGPAGAIAQGGNGR